MLEIRGLRKKYGNFQALDGLDLEIPKGELFGFVGPNGAGKTTTLKSVAGLLAPDEGEVRIDGVDAVRTNKALREKIGYVPDFFGVYDNLKVSEYMEFFASCYGLSGLMGRKRCEELLDQVKLSDRADFFVDSLSRGMKQRLCLARALIHDPGLLILDEPTSGMDPRTRMEFKEMLKELCAEGKTILVSSHILSELSQMCTDIGIIDAGKIVLSGNMAEILQKVNDSNPLLIRICGESRTAIGILKKDPRVQTIAIRDEDIIVNFHGNRQAEAELLYSLMEAGIPVSGFIREQGDLESIFMQITSHDKGKVVLSSEE